MAPITLVAVFWGVRYERLAYELAEQIGARDDDTLALLLVRNGAPQSFATAPHLPRDVTELCTGQRLSLGRARNFALAHFDTEFVAFLDVDDVVDLDKIEILRHLIARTGTDVAAYPLRSSPWSAAYWLRERLLRFASGCPMLRFALQIWFGILAINSSAVMRTSLVRNIGGYFEASQALESWPLAAMLLLTARFELSSGSVQYRRDRGSLSATSRVTALDVESAVREVEERITMAQANLRFFDICALSIARQFPQLLALTLRGGYPCIVTRWIP